jgi:methyl-accepting chemotaxis protein
MKLGAKVSSAFVVLVLLSMIVGGVGYWGMNKLGNITDDLGKNRMVKVDALGELLQAQTAIKAAERTLMISGLDRTLATRQLDEVKRAWDRADKAWKRYESLPITGTGKALWDKQIASWNAWKKEHQEFMRLYEDYVRSNFSPALQATVQSQGMDRGYRAFVEAEKNLNAMIEHNNKQAEAQLVAADSAEKTAIYILLGVLLLVLVLAAVMGILFVKNINGIVTDLLAETERLVSAAVAGKLDTRGNVKKVNFEFRGIVEGINKTLDAVIGPLNVAAEYVDRISKGDIPPKITDNYNGDFNEIKNNLNQAIDAVNALVTDANMLSVAAVEGRLDTRADASKHGGDFRKIVEGVNKTLDAVIGPLNVAAEYVDRISKGDIPPKITDNYNGDFNEIKNNLNQAIDAVNALVTDANMLSVAAVEGRLDTRADASKHGGDFRKIVEGVNKTLDAVIGPLNVAAEYVDRISKGDIPPKITDNYNGDFNEIKNNLNNAIDNINALVIDANMLVVAAVEGKLATRADATKHGGDFRKIVEGVNKTLDSVIGPLNVAADYVDKISKGEIPPKITDTYNGDFNTIKNNLNQAIDAVNALVADAAMLSVAAVEGKLATRADATKHQGDYRRIVEGVNKTLDSVIGPLNVAADYVDKISRGNMPPVITDSYNGDFNTIKNNLNRCIEAVNGLIAESVTLSRAAVEGRLQTRGKADKFEGGYREIVQGVNDTLDAVLKPIDEAADCLKEMANGNLNVEVKGNYQGDHAIIKDALNGTIDAMNDILSQVSVAVEQVSAGSREIATSSQALSQGATESASAVEEISASMQEMGSQTNQNAENATQANQLAVLARDNAEKGNGQMTQMVKAMGDINQSANNISKIIKVIDEIAFQTNLLALNAAVEAARAGKHGKGFTVVAEEVRNLAQRSAKAAKETTEMIEDSIKRTEIGTTIAENTSKALEEIVVGATKVTDLISEIAAASKEQAQGIGQINNGLGQVDQVTQQNTASAEEMASAGEELSSQSLQLKQMLAKFQLKRAAGSHLGGGYGGGYGGDHFDAGPPARQSSSRQRVDVPWGGTPAKSGRKNTRGGEVKPEEIISLDDQHFGKF